MKLTPNFSLSEFLSDGDTPPPESAVKQLKLLAQRLQTLRDIINHPITITSGYRSVAHNRRVGGEPNSYHIEGMAADIVVDGMPPRELQQFLANWSGGLGSYATFTHVDIGPKRRWKG